MWQFIRAAVITILGAASAKASLAGYELLIVSLDSLVMNTYSAQNFEGDDDFSSSMHKTTKEIRGNYRNVRHSSGATGYSAGTDMP